MRVSASSAISTSDCPAPTVSTMIAVEAGGVEHVDHRARSCATARRSWPRDGERADEDVLVRAVLAHADAVAEHGAAGDRARRIDRDHGDALARAPASSPSSALTSVDLPRPARR